MLKYLPTIGMEVHVELATESKMFCSCANGLGMEKEPNKNICPVCTGQPGSLPVPNEKAIRFVLQAGLALGCQIAQISKFDRKNYFYPDLPKGYQISQYDQPLCGRGFLDLEIDPKEGDRYIKRVGITRIHLEEDTGKLIHSPTGKGTLVDFNRAGVPLMELVTEPEINSSVEAKAFCQQLQLLLRYLKISPANMEKGQMRCEANISLYKRGENPLSGTKVELKNLNSFKAVERGIEFEIIRQTEILEAGGEIVQETRGWDEDRGESFSQRSKESSDDYRYFPEPDLLPLKFSREEIEELKRNLPELPWEKKRRLIEQFGLKEATVRVLANVPDLAGYFEEVASELENWLGEEGYTFSSKGREKIFQLAANYLLTEIQKHLFVRGKKMADLKISPENFAELIKLVYSETINSSAAQIVLEEMFLHGGDPSQIVEEKKLVQNSDSEALEKIASEVLKKNSQSVEDYQKGKENAIKFLLGQIMRETQGSANPTVAMDILKKLLAK